MTKLNSFKIKWLLVPLVLFSLGISNARGTSITYTFSSKAWKASPADWTSNTDGSSFESSGSARGVANNGVNGKCTSPRTFANVNSISIVASSNTTGGKVKISIGGTDIANKSIGNSNNSTYTYNSSDYANIANLSGNVVITVTKPSSKTVWVKSITIVYCDAAPTSLTNGTVGSTTAHLSWTDGSDIGSYEVYRSTSSTAPGASTTPTTTVSTKYVDLTGLTANTPYYWWVRSKCANDCKSKWVAGSSFTTSSSGTSVSLTKAGQTNGSFTMTQGGNAVTSVTTTSSQQVVTITPSPNAGYYLSNLTATDPTTGTATVAADFSKVTYSSGANGNSTITATFSPIWQLRGDFNNWDDSDPLTSYSNGVATITKTLNANTKYEFQFYDARQSTDAARYHGNNGCIVEDISGWQFNTGSPAPNAKLFTGKAGTYTFKFTLSNRNLQIIYPEVTDHPNASYNYFKKWADWNNSFYVYWWGASDLTGYNNAIQVTKSVNICETDYVYFPILTDYTNFIVKTAASGDGAHKTGDITSANSHGGDYHDCTSWREFETYTISYAGGTGSSGGPMTPESGICPGGSQQLSHCTFTKTNYNFAGWSDGDGHTYEDEATITNIQGNINLTAQWVKIPTISRNPSVLTFGDKKVDGSYDLSFTVSAADLYSTNGLTLAVMGSNTGMYSIDKSSVAQTSAGTITSTTVTVTYHPTAAGSHAGADVRITTPNGVGGTVTVSVTLSGTGIYADSFIDALQNTSGYTEANPHTETGSYSTPSLTDKSVATSGTCEQQHYHFVGWVTSAKHAAGTAISDGDLQTPTSAANATYYAVWAKGSTTPSTSYAAITSGLETNKYVIAYSYNGGTQIVLKNTADGTNASTMLEGYNLSLSSSKYSNPDAAYIWELQAQADGSYYIYNTTIKKYVNATTTALTLSSTPTKFTITYDSSNSRWTIQLKDNTSYYVHGYVSGSAYDFRCTTSGSGAKYRVYLYKNESQTTYSDYVTQCCANNVTLSGGSPANGTVVFSPAGPVATCSGAQNVTMTITPAAGYKLTAFSASGVSASGGSPVTSGDASKSAQNIALTFAQDASGTYTASATFTAMTDHYKDQLHNTTNYTGDGKAFNATYTVPTLASTTPDSGCEGEHYKFVGWVEDTYVKSDGTLNSDYTLITGGSAGTASEKTYVAIWAKEL